MKSLFSIFRHSRGAGALPPASPASHKRFAPTFSFSKGYEAVSSPFDQMRRSAVVELQGEDKQLPARARLRLTNLQRDMMRNSPTRVMQDQQRRVNVVGHVGGKMYASFPAAFSAAADEVMAYFNKVWFPRAEFTFRKDFNWLLKTLLTATDVSGNVILVFDDGILTGGNGTGRIRAFEGDEIADVPKVDDYFPKSCVQSQGLVYNNMGMLCGAFVSSSQRGKSVFDPKDGVMSLRMDPFDDNALTNWVVLGDMRRFNQGRAVSPLSSALTTLIDLHETVASEAQAAKYNAQLVAQILHESEDEPGTPAALFGTPSEGGQGQPETEDVVCETLRASQIRYQDMKPKTRLELLDTKRPNANMPAYVEHLSGLAGGSLGMARVHSTLKVQNSYTGFRGEQLMTWLSFEETQRALEREVCDWAARCVITRAVRLGLIKSALPDDWQHMIAWRWPKMREVSETDAQTALAQKFRNGTTSILREVGPGERDKIIAELAEEKRLFDAAGLVHPAEATASGQIKETGENNDEDQADEVPSAGDVPGTPSEG